ncbi:uncharacterized protein LOC122510516 [Leptopilina heterotoma]|uniref:uncharacterized protein LOC122510516 n=1 Tax=Leptopilina heterotoma TaxID=63436 RepID=UPI001CA8C422|nr:uncharacterized protein LOC122510516 [Leptopilina heterotoma]XP_043481161.1 uncharacterized protein LOC122510516 [Leptopilina heterotoma]XP_043481162.1 uncharacterized protein LOC122510516 [Leptopilina heterotoma]XP_043481163.1 uncharacterized protein LOC122510516 [Leptopilina heterotoma]XP_043481164.1 uncharacterized protein LOC122510516 [Leptopilina heterotoma]XP_043481165.1 uncharacterized protein LOC122510516 [Leptopilina heterotoma]XP_043481166.1 uncharacterized protein LOC122510516 [
MSDNSDNRDISFPLPIDEDRLQVARIVAHNRRQVSRPFIPLFPRANVTRENVEVYRQRSITPDIEGQQDSHQLSRESVRRQLFASPIEQQQESSFIHQDEETRMSTSSDTTVSWQRHFGILDIDSSSSIIDNQQPMDIGFDNAPLDLLNQCPIPEKRFKLTEFEDKPSTSKEADSREAQLKQTSAPRKRFKLTEFEDKPSTIKEAGSREARLKQTSAPPISFKLTEFEDKPSARKEAGSREAQLKQTSAPPKRFKLTEFDNKQSTSKEAGSREAQPKQTSVPSKRFKLTEFKDKPSTRKEADSREAQLKQTSAPPKHFKLTEFDNKPSTSKEADLREARLKETSSPPKRRKKAANKKEELKKDEQKKFTIKTGFNESFCPDEELRNVIIDKTRMLSQMFILVTLFVNFALRHPKHSYLRDLWSTEGPDYLSIAYLFKNDTRATGKKEFLDNLRKIYVPEFTQLMGRPFQTFNCEHLSAPIQEMARQLNTNFRTNLSYHAEKRLGLFFKTQYIKNKSSDRKKKKINKFTVKKKIAQQQKQEKRKKKYKKKRKKQMEKKRRKKLFQKEVRQLREASLLLSKPDKRERDREILQQESRERKINTRKQRIFVYDAREPFRKRRKRGKKIPNSNRMTGNKQGEEKEEIEEEEEEEKQDENMEEEDKQEEDKQDENMEEEDKQEEDDETAIDIDNTDSTEFENINNKIKDDVNNLLKDNTCNNLILKQLNEENLNFCDVQSHNKCHLFFKFFMRLQSYFVAKNVSSFILVPIMKPGVKYFTFTNTGLHDLEIMLKKKEILKTQETPKKKVSTVSEIEAKKKSKKEISAVEKEYKIKMSPLKKSIKLLAENKKKLDRELKTLKKNKSFDKKQLTKLENEFEKVKEELMAKESEMNNCRLQHNTIVSERNAGKYIKNEERWEKMFRISKIRTNSNKLKFSGTIMTDGVAVSIIYNVVKPKTVIDFAFTETEKKSLNLNDFQTLKGLDPGLNLAFGGVERNGQCNFNINSQDKHIKIKTKSFRWHTQVNKRKSILYKYGNNPRKYYNDLSSTEEFRDKVNHKDSSTIFLSTKFALKAFFDNQPYQEKRRIAALKWDKYMMVQRESDLLANYIVGDEKKKQLIVIGQPNISPWMKGHIRMSLRVVVKKLVEKQRNSQNLRIVFVDEHRTTRLCSTCNENVKIYKNRTTYCETCKIPWNRDVNAGRNILNIGLVKMGMIPKENLPHWDQFRALSKDE